MRVDIKSFNGTVCLIAFLLLASSNIVLASTPTATTGAASGITATNATMNGTVMPNGLATSAFFQWGMTAGYGNATSPTAVSAAISSSNIFANLAGLSPLSIYHYRLVATNSDGRAYGADQTFVTVARPPSATTRAATSIGGTFATLNGTVIPNGATVYFQWGLTTAYGNATPEYVVAGGSTPWYGYLDGLTPGTRYHYRLIAGNSGGTAYGADGTFTTTTAKPTANTDFASSVTQTSAVLNGDVNPNGLPATVYFQWGLTTGYGNSTASLTIGSGYNDDYVSSSLAGLIPNTQYHYRIVATNAAGSIYGLDQAFITGLLPATALTEPASAVTGTSGNLNGAVNPNGYPASSYYWWGLTTDYGMTTPAVSYGSGNNYVAASASLTGLLPTTTYHYLLLASNSSGVSLGQDQTFTTIGPSPSDTTSPASQIAGTSAVLNGSADPNGLAASSYFEWGLTSNYGNVSVYKALGNGNLAVTLAAGLSNLIPTATYHYTIVATSSGGTAIGADQKFTTVAKKPNVLTLPATNIGQTLAQLQGDIDANGLQTYYYFQYGTTTNYGFATTLLPADQGNTTNLWYQLVYGLSPYTDYHYRIVATNLGGVALGNDMPFKTIAEGPSCTTGPPGAITSNSAVLNGEVIPFNLRATNWFIWGTTTNYGNTTRPGIVTSDSWVTATLTNLMPATTYHYMLMASSMGGGGNGNDQSFTTLSTMITLGNVSQNGNKITFTWTAMVGHIYQIQYKSSLDEANWNDLVRVTATNSNATVSDEIPGVANRIYRVVQAQ